MTYPLASCRTCAAPVGIVYDPAAGEPDVTCHRHANWHPVNSDLFRRQAGRHFADVWATGAGWAWAVFETWPTVCVAAGRAGTAAAAIEAANAAWEREAR